VVRLTENAGVIYEVNLEADAAIEAAFDTWLRDHIADMLQLPGFRAAEIRALEAELYAQLAKDLAEADAA